MINIVKFVWESFADFLDCFSFYLYKLDSVGPVHQNQQRIRLSIHTCAIQRCYYKHDWLHKHLGTGIHLNLPKWQNKCLSNGQKSLFNNPFRYWNLSQKYQCGTLVISLLSLFSRAFVETSNVAPPFEIQTTNLLYPSKWRRASTQKVSFWISLKELTIFI